MANKIVNCKSSVYSILAGLFDPLLKFDNEGMKTNEL